MKTTNQQWDDTLNSKESQEMLSDIEKKLMEEIENDPSLFPNDDTSN